MVIGVLALQGDVREHLAALEGAGAVPLPFRTPAQVPGLDALVMPGGESTTLGLLMGRFGLLEPIRALALEGKPILGTCAGLILLASRIEGSDQPRLGLMEISVARNAYGRQRESFEADLQIEALGPSPFRGVFIRAPRILGVGPGVQVLARHQETPVLARQGNLLACCFHPELTQDLRLHRYFLSMG